MRTLIPGIGSKTKYPIDFSLAPLGVILMEFSVLATQLTRDTYSSLGNLIAMRLVHTIFMMFLTISVLMILTRSKKTELNYLAIAIICTVVIALGDLMHGYLASVFGIELVSVYRRIGIIILQGILWFPALIIVVGNRREVIANFKKYEQRLLVATRARSRTSDEFKNLQKQIQDRIRLELYELCNALKSSIEKRVGSSGTIAERNMVVRPLLVGEELRKLSRRLETLESKSKGSIFLGLNTRSISLLVQQFRILYSTTVRSAPLDRSAYFFVLVALVTPPYINFYSFKESLFSYPILLFLIFIFTLFIRTAQQSTSPNSLRFSSALIFITGLLPFAVNLLGQAVFHDPQTNFPILITAVALPITYYIFMELFQVLRPKALNIIQKDQLTASSGLQDSISKIVSDEFSQNLSHQWAVFIHGKILTRLAATSLKLESAAISGDARAFNTTIDSLFSLLSAPDAEFEEESTDLETEINSRLKPWIGLLEINLQVDSDLKGIRNPRVRDVGEVIEELISNSIRHGKAKKIELKVLRSGHKDVEIVAFDDAIVRAPELPIRTGLGTRIFNLASDGRWSITRNGSSTEFRLLMGLEA